MNLARRSAVSAFVLLFLLTTASVAVAATVRWDIVSLAAPDLTGGKAFALANDGSGIVLTGAGTFEPGSPGSATGGGTWATFGGTGEPGEGIYRVGRLVRFTEAPGAIPGAPAARAGLAVFTIFFSDGSSGVLTVSCHLGGTPDSVFEGITASKGFVTFWNRVPPVPGIDANRTLFRVQ